MVNNHEQGKTKKLLLGREVGVPLTSKYLRNLGISPALVGKYVSSGWLKKIVKGVYLFANDSMSDYGVAYAISRDNNFYIGGRSALTLFGNIHYLRASERIDLFGENLKYKIPDWAKSFNLKYTTKSPFDSTLDKNAFVSTSENSPYPTMAVAERERAMLELINGIGSLYSSEEAEQIIETLSTLRKRVLKELLSSCDRIKALKLCRKFGRKLDMPWKDIPEIICKERNIK